MAERISPIELIVTDLDGTLWERPESLPRQTATALHEIGSGAIPLLVATGRRLVSTREPLAALGVAPPAVVLNGSLGVDLATGDRFHVGGFEPASAGHVLAAFADREIEPCVYVDHDSPSVWIGDNPSTHPEHLASFGDDVRATDLSRVIEQSAVLAFGVLGIHADIAHELGDALAPLASPHVAPDRQYGGFSLTVAPPTGSKWDGIEAFCRRHGIDPGAVLAAGDGPNDLEMLQAAAVAVAPVDAHPDALALADHVVGRAADGGWAEIIDLL